MEVPENVVDAIQIGPCGGDYDIQSMVKNGRKATGKCDDSKEMMRQVSIGDFYEDICELTGICEPIPKPAPQKNPEESKKSAGGGGGRGDKEQKEAGSGEREAANSTVDGAIGSGLHVTAITLHTNPVILSTH
ncbi:unnamed protein product [Caenorhabditis sp. 36 PRJEB53466]|nr:unnamed protein product [Caenorhabditis sp. 36 PRJEB53466]